MQNVGKFAIAKSAVANSFAQAAASYDLFATLQRDVADNLISKIDPSIKPSRILDLGCGTGYCTEKLQALYPEAEIISLDIAEGMLILADKKMPLTGVCADAESLPFTANCFDLIVSSLAIQWCKNYPRLFLELKRVLSKDGNIFLSSFGPDTLKELASAWQQVDSFVHVNQFCPKDLLCESALEKELRVRFCEGDRVVKHYDNLKELTSELKAIGAHNMNSGQAKGLSGRHKIALLKKAFESNYLPEQGIPVTYLLYYLALKH